MLQFNKNKHGENKNKTPNNTIDTKNKMKKRILKLWREICKLTGICFVASTGINQ